MANPAEQQPIVQGRIEIDNRELVRPVQSDDVDISARIARNVRVNRSHPLLEGAVELSQCGCESILSEALAGS